MTRSAILHWLERGLLTVGVVLAVWCAAVLVEARYFQTLPVPGAAAPAAVTTLPGDSGTPQERPRSVPTPGSWIARLEAPSVKLSTTVLEGSDDQTLRRGAGHIEDTALPGEMGNIGIAGHRDTIFRPVRKLRVGDSLELTTSDRVYRYRIAKTSIVNPEDVYVLDPTPQPTLTLVTCYPFEFVGHAPQRFIVHAELVEDVARAVPPAGGAR
jgi:sortase A